MATSTQKCGLKLMFLIYANLFLSFLVFRGSSFQWLWSGNNVWLVSVNQYGSVARVGDGASHLQNTLETGVPRAFQMGSRARNILNTGRRLPNATAIGSALMKSTDPALSSLSELLKNLKQDFSSWTNESFPPPPISKDIATLSKIFVGADLLPESGLITCAWDSGVRLGNGLFAFAAVIGNAIRYGLVPVFPAALFQNPRFPIYNYFKLQVPETTRTIQWHGIHEECTACYNAQIFQQLAQPGRNYKISFHLQSWKYFHHAKEFIREVALAHWKDSILMVAKVELKDILTKHCDPSVTDKPCLLIGVHVRRGDFLWGGNVQFGFKSVNRDWILKAMYYYQGRYGSHYKPLFIVAGDDQKWNVKNLSNITDINTAVLPIVSPGVDLCILTMCNHTLMTTGTYGWWASYLAGGEVVYYKDYPPEGFALSRIMRKEDYYPPEWTGL